MLFKDSRNVYRIQQALFAMCLVFTAQCMVYRGTQNTRYKVKGFN